MLVKHNLIAGSMPSPGLPPSISNFPTPSPPPAFIVEEGVRTLPFPPGVSPFIKVVISPYSSSLFEEEEEEEEEESSVAPLPMVETAAAAKASYSARSS